MSQSDISKVTRTTESVGFPDTIVIDNFSGCNLQCSQCDHKNIRKYRKIQRMGWNLYTKMIDEIAKEKPSTRVWEIFFGEPFLCTDMPQRIAYAKNKGLKDVVLNTNGVLMTPDKSLEVIKAGLDAISVGIDAYKHSTYDKIRVGGDYIRVVRNVLDYQGLLHQYGHDGQRLFVQFVESDLNASEVGDFRKFWNSRGIAVKIRPKVSWAGLVDASNLTAENQSRRKPCYWLMRTMAICADGSVALCGVDLHCRVKCGDANTQTIKELWDGKLAEYRSMHREGRWSELPAMCRDCMDWQSTYSETIE
jgi:uncharacterized Fe-S cluster-containing radical SAM superfamily protein